MSIKNVLFDFNGTIVNDLDLCIELLNTMLEKKNHNTVSKKEYLEIFDFPIIEYYKKAGFIFPEDDFDELAKFFIKEYSSRNKYCQLNKGVLDTLKHCKALGKKLYIVSASENSLLIDQLKSLGIYSYFDGVSGIDNIHASSKIEMAKNFIKEHNIISEESIFIGDTLHDVECASNLNMDCILINQGHQSKKRLENSKKVVLESMEELIKLID